MSENNKQNLAVTLRRCADCLCDESCPYFNVDPDCEVKLMRDAADALEALLLDASGQSDAR